MKDKEKQRNVQKGILISVLLLLLIGAFILIILLMHFLNGSTNKEVIDHSENIYNNMLKLVNLDIADKEDKATELVCFEYSGYDINISAKSDKQLFFYTYKLSEKESMDDVVTSFDELNGRYYDNYSIDYYEISDKQYGDNKLDPKQYITCTGKAVINNATHYFISVLMKDKSSYVPVFKEESYKFYPNIRYDDRVHYSKEDSPKLIYLYEYMFSLVKEEPTPIPSN